MTMGRSHPTVAGLVVIAEMTTLTGRPIPIDAVSRCAALAIESSAGALVRDSVVTCVAAETNRNEKTSTPTSHTGKIHASSTSAAASW